MPNRSCRNMSHASQPGSSPHSRINSAMSTCFSFAGQLRHSTRRSSFCLCDNMLFPSLVSHSVLVSIADVSYISLTKRQDSWTRHFSLRHWSSHPRNPKTRSVAPYHKFHPPPHTLLILSQFKELKVCLLLLSTMPPLTAFCGNLRQCTPKAYMLRIKQCKFFVSLHVNFFSLYPSFLQLLVANLPGYIIHSNISIHLLAFLQKDVRPGYEQESFPL